MNSPEMSQVHYDVSRERALPFDRKMYMNGVMHVGSEDSEKPLHSIISDYTHIAEESNMPKERNYPLTKEAFERAGNRKGGGFQLGQGSYIVPGGLQEFNMNMRNKWLQSITFKTGQLCNIQERIGLIAKDQEGNFHHFSNDYPLNSLDVTIGDRSSLAHSATFVAKKGETGWYISTHIGNDCFIGINASVGCSTLGNNVSLWFNAKVGHDVRLGNNILIGMGAEITDGVHICDQRGVTGDNYIIPPNAYIDKNFKTITYSDYRKNQDYYDHEYVRDNTDSSGNSMMRPNFIILQDTPLDQDDDDFQTIAHFNNHVIEDNERHARVDEFLGILHEYYEFYKGKNGKSDNAPNIYFYERFITNLNKFRGYSNHPIPREITHEVGEDTTFSCKAYPKDIEHFLRYQMPELARMMSNQEDIGPKLIEYMDFPTVDGLASHQKGFIEKVKEMALGDNGLVGRVALKNVRICNLRARKDEGRNEEEWSVQNSVLFDTTIHGGGEKVIVDSFIDNAVVHGSQKIDKCTVAGHQYPTTLNNTILTQVTTFHGDVTMNNGVACNVNFKGRSVITAPASAPVIFTSLEKEFHVGNNVTLKGGNTVRHSIPQNTYISEGKLI